MGQRPDLAAYRLGVSRARAELAQERAERFSDLYKPFPSSTETTRRSGSVATRPGARACSSRHPCSTATKAISRGPAQRRSEPDRDGGTGGSGDRRGSAGDTRLREHLRGRSVPGTDGTACGPPGLATGLEANSTRAISAGTPSWESWRQYDADPLPARHARPPSSQCAEAEHGRRRQGHAVTREARATALL